MTTFVTPTATLPRFVNESLVDSLGVTKESLLLWKGKGGALFSFGVGLPLNTGTYIINHRPRTRLLLSGVPRLLFCFY